MTNNKSLASGLMHQYHVQRKNLLFACRLAVKSLIDKACLETVDDTSEELQNFCIIMEHILCHRLKTQQKWYGGNEVRSLWEYIRMACTDVKHNCLKNIKSLEKPKTSQGKGRAWIRMALMEKRLSDYLSTALQQMRLTRAFYADGAMMLTEEMHVLTGVLLGLNAIDFSLDIRNEDLDQPYMPVINFTPYLRYVQVEEKTRENVELQELSEMSTSVVSDVFGDDDLTDTWPSRFSRLDNKYRLVMEQKGYLEELVRLRENQLTEMHSQKQKLVEAMQHYEAESCKDRQQLESVIIELQAQLSKMKEDQRSQRERLQNVVQVVHYQTDPPNASFHSSADAAIKSPMSGNQQHSEQHLERPSSSTDASKTFSLHLDTSDSKSVISSASTLSAITVPRKSDDSHSMVPLAGSFTSETSFKSGDMAAPVSDQVASTGVKQEENDGIEISKPVSSEAKTGGKLEEGDWKQIMEFKSCNTNDPPSQQPDQSSQKLTLHRNGNENSRSQGPSANTDSNNGTEPDKEHLNPKGEQGRMEKGDEEKPVLSS